MSILKPRTGSPRWDRILGTLVTQINGEISGSGVTSVNGESGVVTLDADDIDDAGTVNKFTDAGTLSDVAANTAARHAQSHTIASHSDTTATGAELETLTDGSDADSLHTHGTAIHDNITGEINALSEKTTPVNADIVLIEDSAASYAKKKVLMSNMLGGTAAGGTFNIDDGSASASGTFTFDDGDST